MAGELRTDRVLPPVRGGCQPGAGSGVLWQALRDAVSGLVAQAGRAELDIVDAGGGTGGFAVPLASLGHNVTVVDPSPDSLAGAQRRAAEAGVALRAVQGDVCDLAAATGASGADLVLCHSVLEYVESPQAAMAAVAGVLRPGGAVSVLAASVVAAVIHRVLAGRFEEARRLIATAGPPGGAGPRRAGGPEFAAGPPGGAAPGEGGGPVAAAGPPGCAGPGEGVRWSTAGERLPDDSQDGLPRRFTLPAVIELIEQAGLRAGPGHGVGVFTDLVPSLLADTEPGAAGALAALEQAASAHPDFRGMATQFHVLGYR